MLNARQEILESFKKLQLINKTLSQILSDLKELKDLKKGERNV